MIIHATKADLPIPIQIQHLLKLNIVFQDYQDYIFHSNTTLVKVKFGRNNKWTDCRQSYSNTTLVKVKYNLKMLDYPKEL